jgi:ubiquinone/menaquinone biosynthesis C-methylase UbiE
MSIKESYNSWASQYDTNINRTRDLESVALRRVLENISFDNCLEIGCGTGKNTIWLIEKAKYLLAIDLSEEMLKRAKEKVISKNIEFRQFDITQTWQFTKKMYDLISFSLVLEHIANLEHIFAEAAKLLRKDGFLYLGELHPYKQYSGTKARYDTESGTQVVECYNHNISDFVQIAKKHGFCVSDLDEHFDDGDRNSTPRILTILLRRV